MNRVRFILDVTLKPGSEDDLLRAYGKLRERVAEQPGLLGHQLCQAIDDPTRWQVISEWESLEASAAWDQSDEHRALIGPMRACFLRASNTKLEVRAGVGS